MNRCYYIIPSQVAYSALPVPCWYTDPQKGSLPYGPYAAQTSDPSPLPSLFLMGSGRFQLYSFGSGDFIYILGSGYWRIYQEISGYACRAYAEKALNSAGSFMEHYRSTFGSLNFSYCYRGEHLWPIRPTHGSHLPCITRFSEPVVDFWSSGLL